MFLTLEELKALTTFDEVAGLDNDSLNGYMLRADAWIRRATKRNDLLNTTNESIQQDLKIATLLLVEYIWYWDLPETKEQAISHDDSVKLGSYTFNKDKARIGEETGNDELDGILRSLRYSPKSGAFFVVRNGDS